MVNCMAAMDAKYPGRTCDVASNVHYSPFEVMLNKSMDVFERHVVNS